MPNYGLIFDVDGTIGNTEPINARATGQVLAEMFGIRGLTADDFVDGFGRGAAKYTEVGAARHGVKLSAEQLARAVPARAQRILQLIRSEGLPSFPGVIELGRAALADERFRVAVASSAEPELVQAIIAAVGFPTENVPILTGEHVHKKKPDPEVFILAARAINVPPERCVVVEDAPDGVTAAKAAGCRCIGLTTSVPAEKLAHADRVMKDLAGVTADDLVAMIEK